MDNPYPENIIYSHEQNLAAENASTNAKPVTAKKEKPILLRVFYKVFLGFFADIFGGIFNFFKRYVLLVWHCIKFIWNPNAEEHTRANEQTLSNAKETFELILIITTVMLFLIKQNVLNSSDELKELYGNDIQQYAVEFVLFLAYAAAYFTVLVILVLLGRLLRKVFKPIESKEVTDKLFINLNNIFFIFTTIYAFVKKFDYDSATLLEREDAGWYENFFIYYFIPLAAILILFFIRLVALNKITVGRIFTYCVITPVITAVILGISGLMLTALFAYL